MSLYQEMALVAAEKVACPLLEVPIGLAGDPGTGTGYGLRRLTIGRESVPI
jgi:hypothetical protein